MPDHDNDHLETALVNLGDAIDIASHSPATPNSLRTLKHLALALISVVDREQGDGTT